MTERAPLAMRLRHGAHLVWRFLGSLPPWGPSPAAERFVRARLDPAEWDLWRTLSGPDRRHALGVARRAEAAGAGPDGVAAALLHDVGKLESGLGTGGRVVATLVGLGLGHRRAVTTLTTKGGFPGRCGRYLDHARLGGELLRRAGARPLATAWAREHHDPPGAGSVPADLARVLRAADGD